MKSRILIFFLTTVIGMGMFFSAPARGEGDPQEAKRARVHDLIVARLASGLNLNQAEAEKLGQVLKENHLRKKRLRAEVRRLTEQLRQDTQLGDKKQIQATLKKLQEANDQLDRSDEMMFARVKTMLDPNQLAQFVLIMDEIRHEIRAVRRRSPRQLPAPAPGTAPAVNAPQQGYTQQPSDPYYRRGYYPPPREGGVWVGD